MKHPWPTLVVRRSRCKWDLILVVVEVPPHHTAVHPVGQLAVSEEIRGAVPQFVDFGRGLGDRSTPVSRTRPFITTLDPDCRATHQRCLTKSISKYGAALQPIVEGMTSPDDTSRAPQIHLIKHLACFT